MGLRLFRVPFLWERMQTTLDGALDTNYFALYNSLITHILAKGDATVVIDPHNYARYNGAIIGASGSGVTVDNFVNFWNLLAANWKTRADLVVFGLMNEPNSMSSNTWFATAQAVITSLRNNGFTNTITVPGNFYTGAWTWKSTDSWISTDSPVISNADMALTITDPLNNIVFEVHQYFDSDSSGSSSTCDSTKTASSVFSDLASWAETNDKYIYLGEFAGADNTACQTLLTGVFSYAAANPRFLGTTWWSGGPWWGDAWYLFEDYPSLTTAVAQMTWQQSSVISTGRSTGYDPTASTGTPTTGSSTTTPSTASGTPSSTPSATPTVTSTGPSATPVASVEPMTPTNSSSVDEPGNAASNVAFSGLVALVASLVALFVF